ncbi:hypothetical protein [Devosia sp.]|uniref:hypothetical protein n=1 Tax=Devosia sp. TaxID=1871048 RepID=UPI002AFF2AFA|nr:hypothetical protein [Devosia sp.]
MIYFLAESLLVVFEFATLLVGLLIVYLIRQLSGRPPALVRGKPARIRLPAYSCAAIALGTLALTHAAIILWGTLPAFLILIVGLAGGVWLYFRTLASHVEGTPIRYVLFVWITLAISLAALLGVVSWGAWRAPLLLSDGDFTSLASVVAPLAQMAGILIAALGVVVANIFTSQQEQKAASRSIYQKLEFGAIELFRFEKDHADLVDILWFSDGPPKLSAQQAHHFEQYVCQYLNLFEMAVRLRIDRVMPPDVFASWVPWMYEICALDSFAWLWRDGLRTHYVRAFRELIDTGIELAAVDEDESGLSATAEKFYAAAARVAGSGKDCQHVHRWLAEARRANAEPAAR